MKATVTKVDNMANAVFAVTFDQTTAQCGFVRTVHNSAGDTVDWRQAPDLRPEQYFTIFVTKQPAESPDPARGQVWALLP